MNAFRNIRRTAAVMVVTLASLTGVAAASAPEPDASRPATTDHALVVDQVNSLPYWYGYRPPAEEAFRLVAELRGWSPNAIEAWVPAVLDDFIRGESGYCPNVIGGAKMTQDPFDGCNIRKQGWRQDAGFGQLVRVHYGGWLCAQEGLCSKWEIIDTPFESMTAVVALLERSGKGPWCYNRKAIRYHWFGCNNAPGALPLTIQ